METAAPAPTAARAHRRGSSRLPLLLDVAAHAFAERGFAGASVREICGAAGMLPGSLYCHFATKEALLVAVCEEGVRRISKAVDEAVAGLEGGWPRLEAAAVAHVAALLDRSDYSQVVIRVRPTDAPSVERELAALRDDYERRWVRLAADLPLARPVRRADLRLFLLGALNWTHTWYRPDGDLTPERIARRLVRLLRGSLETA